jgi:hypothetical protein
MLLGDLIAQFSEEATAEEAILRLQDLTLLANLRAQSDAAGMALGAYASAAASRYAAEASEEEWLTLIGAMNRAEDPGHVYLGRAFAHAAKTC